MICSFCTYKVVLCEMKIDRSRDEEAGNVRYNFSDGFKNIFQYFGAMKIDQPGGSETISEWFHEELFLE